MTVVPIDSRRPVLGGSTIAAAVGIDPYVSPIRLWLEMTGRIVREQSEAMALGKHLEPVIFDVLRERGYPCERTPHIELRDDAVPWLVGHPDGVRLDTHGGGIVEAKATGRPTDTLPVPHEAQVQTYMRLAGVDHALVAQLGGLTFTVWEVDYNPHLWDVLHELAESFVAHVRSDTPPPPLGHSDDRAALGLTYADVTPGKRVRETRDVRRARHELAVLLEAERRRSESIEHLRATITAYMGDADTLVSAHDDVVATWKPVTSHRLDGKRLKAERPDVHATYTQPTHSRRFLLT